MSTIKGKVIFVGEIVEVSEKFRKREFVVNTNEQYPQAILIQVTQDKCESVPPEFSDVEVHYNLRGREWTNPQTGERRFFNTIEAWKIDVI